VHEEAFELVAIAQLIESAVFGPPAETIEGAEGSIFRLSISSWMTSLPETHAGQTHKRLEVAIPKETGGCLIAGSETVDPIRHAVIAEVGHASPPRAGVGRNIAWKWGTILILSRANQSAKQE
jgi:hypothetical protein